MQAAIRYSGKQIISIETCKITRIAIMATCGLYDETGTHMVRTGMPAKSGVSGYIMAVGPRKSRYCSISPRVNQKETASAAKYYWEGLSKAMEWHFAMP